MSRACNSQPNSALWSSREMEILAVTLKLLQEQGFERLTVGDVAAAARASKATLYRRWKTKGELVLASVCWIWTRRARGGDWNTAGRSTSVRTGHLRSHEGACRHHSCGVGGGGAQRRAHAGVAASAR